MEQKESTLSRVLAFFRRHPQLVSWIGLGIAMEVILWFSARDVGLLPSQMAALMIATFLLAGLCVWIIGWE